MRASTSQSRSGLIKPSLMLVSKEIMGWYSIYYVEVQTFLLIAELDRYICPACDLVALTRVRYDGFHALEFIVISQVLVSIHRQNVAF